jgi:hypothetical protein
MEIASKVRYLMRISRYQQTKGTVSYSSAHELHRASHNLNACAGYVARLVLLWRLEIVLFVIW